MTEPVPLTPSELRGRFAAIIAGLCRAVASRAAADRALAPLLVLVWGRLRRMTVRFASRALEQGAGRVAAPTVSRRVTGGVRSSGPRQGLPRGFGWLVRLVPEAACYGGQLQRLLSEPGMAELLAEAPGARRVLRPMCRMLALVPGPELMPPADKKRGRRGAADGDGGVGQSPVRSAAGSRVRARRQRVPRQAGLPWLRWRPAEA